MSTARIVEILETLAPVMVAPETVETTDSFVDVGLIDAEGKTRVVYVVTNTDAANTIEWKVLASLDNSTFVELEAAADLAAEATASWVADSAEASYRYFKVQVKSKVAETPGDLSLRGYAKM